MGPLLSVNNELVKEGNLPRTYAEELDELISTLRFEVSKLEKDVELLFMPSLDDVTNYYPIPQPKYDCEFQE